jgi:hypothetical protein
VSTSALRRPAWWAVAAVGLIAALIMSLTWPLNYDEAFNYLYFADRGFRFTVTDYSYPNNHVLFTLIQALIPRRLVEADPYVLRIPNLFLSAALVGVLARDSRRAWAGSLKALAIVFAGPSALQYFGQARGFQLGTLLAALALLAALRWADRRWGWVAAALLMALATWAVPTFAYGAPILTAYYGLRRDLRAAVGYSVLYLAVAMALYGPILDQVFSQRTNSFSQFRPFGDYAGDLVSSSFFLPTLLAIALFGLAGWAWLRSILVAEIEPEAGRAFLFIGFPLAFVLIAEVIPALGIAASPFVRSASFLPAFLLVGLWNAPTWKVPTWRWAATGLMAINLALGVGWWQGIADGSGITNFHGTAFGQTPRLDPLLDDDLAVAAVRCGWTDEWTCRLYEQRLIDHGITVAYPKEEVPAGTCVVGKHPPRPGTGIEVVLEDGRRGLVCYG